ncbi:hypothetical protein BFW01_g4916 [Lasiodiplodia theobromae]|nr:hypothetical protein BFW01_g4916 [Lasiodiplodia theobromae]
MANSFTSTGAAASRAIMPEPFTTPLEFNQPEPFYEKTEAKYKDMLDIARQASEKALQTYRELSQGNTPGSSRRQRALDTVESAIAVLQTQRDEADVHVQSLTATVAERAAQRNLTDEDVGILQTDIRNWTRERTKQELLLDSANKQRNSAIEQLCEIHWNKCQRILKMLLCVPITQKRSYRPSQGSWRKNVLHYYDAVRKVSYPDFMERREQIWDPVMHCWAPGEAMKAANILPYGMSNEVLRMIFGEEEEAEILFDIRNCLFLCEPLELAFDEGIFVLVPVGESNQESPTDYKLVLLKESLRTARVTHPGEMTWNDLDGTVLEFRNDCRPREKFMYLNFVSRIIAARKLRYNHLFRMHLENISRAWVSPAKWIRRSMIYEVARIVDDHEIPEIFQEGTSDGEDGRDNPRNDKLSRAAESWVTEIFFRELFERDPEEEEEDEEGEYFN